MSNAVMRALAVVILLSFGCTPANQPDAGLGRFVPPDGIYGGKSCRNGFCHDLICGGPLPDNPQKCSGCTTIECPGLSRCNGPGACIDDYVISCSTSGVTAFSVAYGSVKPQWPLPQVSADSVAIAAGRVVAASGSTLFTPDASFDLGDAGRTWLQGSGDLVYTSSANGTVRTLQLTTTGAFVERSALDLGTSAGPLTVSGNRWVFVTDGGVREGVELAPTEPLVELRRVQLPAHDGAWLPTDVLFDEGQALALFGGGWVARLAPDAGVRLTEVPSCATPVGFAKADLTLAVACTDRVQLLSSDGSVMTWSSTIGRLTMARVVGAQLFIGNDVGTVVMLDPRQARVSGWISNPCVGEVRDLRLGP